MALLNVRSLTNKTFVINELIAERQLDCMFLTETWLNSDAPAILIETSPSSYSFEFSLSTGKKGGGTVSIWAIWANYLPFVRSFVRSVVFPVAVNHSVSRSDSLPPSAPRSHSRIANASRVVQTHFLPPPLVLIRESRMPAESFRLTSSLRPSFSFANRECQPSRSDSLPPSFTITPTFKQITNAQCSSHS